MNPSLNPNADRDWLSLSPPTVIRLVPRSGELDRLCSTMVEISSTLYEKGPQPSLRNDPMSCVSWVNGLVHVALL